VRSGVRGMRKELHGGRVGLSPTPKSFVEQPWNTLNMLLAAQGTTAGQPSLIVSFSAGDLVNSFQIVNGLPTTVNNFEFRLLKVDAWATGGEPSTVINNQTFGVTIEMLPFSMVNANTGFQRNKGIAGYMTPARVSFVWPLADSTTPFGTTGSRSLFRIELSDNTPVGTNVRLEVMCKLRFLWRFRLETGLKSEQLSVSLSPHGHINQSGVLRHMNNVAEESQSGALDEEWQDDVPPLPSTSAPMWIESE